jgi:hypothetical protein
MSLAGKTMYETIEVDGKRLVTRTTRIIKEFINETGERMYQVRIMMAGFGMIHRVKAEKIEQQYEKLNQKG